MLRSLHIILLLSLCAIQVQAQQPFLRDLWLNESHTPVKVNDMKEDARGYIWLATDAGLYRFNGRNVTLLSDDKDKPVTAVTPYNNEVWAGYADGGLAIVQGNELRTVKLSGSVPASAITSLHVAGGMLMATTEEHGILAIMAGSVVSFDASKGLSDNFVYRLSVQGRQKLMAGTDRGLNIIVPNKDSFHISNITMQHGLPDNIVRVLEPVPGGPAYWLGMQQGGVALFSSSDNKVTVPRMAAAWQWGQVNDILPISATHAWIATEDGYLLEARLYGSDSLGIEVSQLENKRIYKLLRGRSGIIWCATNEGLTLATAEYMRRIPMQPPFSMGAVRAMTADKNDVLWYAQDNVLYNMPLHTTGALPRKAATLPAEVSSLYADDEGRIWIGTLGAGVWIREATGNTRMVKGIAELDNGSILDIAGAAGRIWVSGLNGVEELAPPAHTAAQPTLIRHHNKQAGIGSDYVYQVYPDSKGHVWMATDGAGVCMYDNNGNYRKWDTTDGMAGKVTYSIAEDAKGNIWAATPDAGLLRYDGRKWQLLARAQGLQDVKISTIAANATGQLVVVHAQGVDVWYPNSGQFRNYSPRQGFGIDSVSAVLKLYARDREGNVYIPFQSGFIMFKNINSYYDIRPLVNITGITASFQPVQQGRSRFDYSENFISFRYEGINFANPEMLHYRYRLEGYNDNWTVTNDESATFPQLPDGDYTFRVQASLNSNFSRQGGAVYHFTIGKPYWKKAWFIGGMLALVIGIIYIYQRLRERNLKKVSLLQSERMKFEYEHLKSQVNPHFLFNSLNTLTSLIDENTEAAMTYTSRLSDLYRNMLAYRDKDLITLGEEWEILDNYMYIQKTRFGDALRLEADVPEGYMQTRKIIPLALQLLVENAIKHNVVSRSKPLTISIKVTQDYIIVTNPVQQKISKEKGAGLGLINIRKRYSLLSKKNIIFGIENNHYTVILPLL